MINDVNFKIMDFSEALLLMKQGKKVRRKEWTSSAYLYIELTDSGWPYFRFNTEKVFIPEFGDELRVGQIQDDDLLSDDWEEMKS